MTLSPKSRVFLDMIYRAGAPRFHELSVPQARHAFRKLQWAFRPEPPPVASTVDVPIPRPDGSALLARLYRPIGSTPDCRLPLLVYFHGGGWCVGDVESYDTLCRELSNGSGCAVLSVDYRLAPEHPFPAAVEDAWLAVAWAAAEADRLGTDPARMAVGGDSAGGNLAITTCLTARSPALRVRVHVHFALLVYPCTEVTSARASRQRYGEGFSLDQGSLQWFFSRYLPPGAENDWRASPMLANSLAGVPPMLLVTAECDPLVDDCVAFAERVRAEGGTVQHLAVAGVVHGFFTLGKYFPEAGEAVRHATVALRDALGAGR